MPVLPAASKQRLTAPTSTPGVGSTDPNLKMAIIPRVNSSLRRRSGVLNAEVKTESTQPPGTT